MEVAEEAEEATARPIPVGVTVTGLKGTVVLQNNGGSNLTVTTDGTYAFTAEYQAAPVTR